MLEARSVAVVGASPKPASPGNHMVKQLLVGGFSGDAAAVNPRYDAVEGVACYPSLDDVPFAPDLVLLGVGNAAVEEQMAAAAERGVRGVVVFASGLEGSRRVSVPLEERLSRIAREAGMVVCGGNCMGFVDVERGLRALAFEERADLQPGKVAWISHSGSAFSALLHAERGVHFNLAVSAGQELTTTMADYMHYALERDSTRAIALFLETVRDPENFQDLPSRRPRSATCRWSRSRWAARRSPAGSSPPTRARSPATTRPTRHCSTPTGWPASAR